MNEYDPTTAVLSFKIPYHPLTGTLLLNKVQPYTEKIIRSYLGRLSSRVVQDAMAANHTGFARAVPTSAGTELHYPYVFTMVSRESGEPMTLSDIVRSVRESWTVNSDKWQLVATLADGVLRADTTE